MKVAQSLSISCQCNKLTDGPCCFKWLHRQDKFMHYMLNCDEATVGRNIGVQVPALRKKACYHESCRTCQSGLLCVLSTREVLQLMLFVKVFEYSEQDSDCFMFWFHGSNVWYQARPSNNTFEKRWSMGTLQGMIFCLGWVLLSTDQEMRKQLFSYIENTRAHESKPGCIKACNLRSWTA